MSVHKRSSTKNVNFVVVEHGFEHIWLSLSTKPPPVFRRRVRLMSPAPSAGLLTFTEKVQFVPHPSVAPEVTALTVSFSRTGVPVAATTSSIVNIQSVPESKHSFVAVPKVEGF